MSAVYVSNIVINIGSDFSQDFTLTNSSDNSLVDLTGYTVISKMRKYSSSSNFYQFNVSILQPALGIIHLFMPNSVTSTIKPGRYIYDIVIIDSASIKNRVVEGMVLVREGATT
jgi:hypothetical protein